MLQTFNIPAGGRIVNAKARFIRYESASAGGSDESLRVRADGNDLGSYLPGDSITLPIDASTWEITPATASATAVVRLGIGGVESSRVFGVVQVVDSDRFSTLRNRAYMGGDATPVPAAGQFASLTLWNPSTSGVVVNVDTFQVDAYAASTGVLCGQVFAASGLPSSTPSPGSKLSGGSAANAVFYRKSDHATDPGLLVPSPAYWGATVGANSNAQFKLKRPICIKPGFGLMFAGRTAAAALGVSFEFTEEPAN